jgi:RHH-type proline utilization regulon transcriptional repressor/proline dehydrogenase/delta 1-pyrroline-5-carboxylate dehydrogenase
MATRAEHLRHDNRLATASSTEAALDLGVLEAVTQRIGRELFEHISRAPASVLSRQWWDDHLVEWTTTDPAVKNQLFRFIDVLPMLRDDSSLLAHLHEYLDPVAEHMPSTMRMAIAVARPGSLTGRAMAIAARRNVLAYARRFIAGTSADEVLATAAKARALGRAFTLDRLGEAVTSDVEADEYLGSYLELIEAVAPTVNAWPERPALDRDAHGTLPRMNVSVKLSALDAHFNPTDAVGTARRVKSRLCELLRAAARHGAHVHVDMESYATKDLTLAIFRDVLAEPEFRDTPDVGIVVQCYLKDAARDVEELSAWARRRGAPVWVRLVKGAYWDYETAHARALGWPVPVFEQKWQSDAMFESQCRAVMADAAYLRPAIASHNVRSLAYALAVADQLGLARDDFEIQMLYGMGDAEKQALVDRGHRLRIYMPFGELIPGMAYLVRRLLENTSNDSFIKAGFHGNVPVEKLLAPPSFSPQPDESMAPADPRSFAIGSRDNGSFGLSSDLRRATTNTESAMCTSLFANEPPTNFAVSENRNAMSAALASAAEQFGRHAPLVIDGRDVDSRERLTSINPSHREQVVGTAAMASTEHVDRAVAAARRVLPKWADIDVERRAEYLLAVAGRMRSRRFELAAWIIHESGKGWSEADADVAEAIDFCEYYARQAVRLLAPRDVTVPGETNRLTHDPRGVAAVIAPWNFPLAILTGMTTAALVAGNPVIMKPAEQTPLVAAELMRIFREVELPAGVAQYLPGTGETAGAALSAHPGVDMIAFTGSRQVGMALYRRGAEQSGTVRPRIKHVIAEMGGKNAIIVDADADLDEAVLGVMHSAFGFQGQKCSACSRAIVLGDVYDRFLNRLVEATRSITVAPAEDPGSLLGPLVDADAVAKVQRYIDIGKNEARLVLAGEVGDLADEGYYVGAHIFADVPPDAVIAREEIFGPVLAVIRARDLDEAFAIANASDYALTGGMFSRSPANLGRARRELEVGNLYLNRAITGALVGRQPFGGFKLSGIGHKAGGPDYVLQFTHSRTVTENTMRRGFAPENVS